MRTPLGWRLKGDFDLAVTLPWGLSRLLYKRMRIISRKPINEFAEVHPECAAGLSHWWREMKKGNFSNVQEVRSVFPHADKDGKFTIFNVGGNKARIVAAIHYGDRKRVYIRHVLTHNEYDLGKWRE